jgi:hypothetical protein
MDVTAFFKDSYYGIYDTTPDNLRAGYVRLFPPFIFNDRHRSHSPIQRPHSKWSWEGQTLASFDEFLEKVTVIAIDLFPRTLS